MNRFGLTTSLAIYLPSLVACCSGAHKLAALHQQEVGNGFGHKKLQPLESTDPAKAAFGGL